MLWKETQRQLTNDESESEGETSDKGGEYGFHKALIRA